MVGWSRRNSEDARRARRHRAWVEGLTNEERRLYDADKLAREIRTKKLFQKEFAVLTPIWMVGAALSPLFGDGLKLAFMFYTVLMLMWWSILLVDYKDVP